MASSILCSSAPGILASPAEAEATEAEDGADAEQDSDVVEESDVVEDSDVAEDSDDEKGEGIVMVYSRPFEQTGWSEL
ncbi:MAG: hypothetical protein OIF57_10370 [Marinobacterium sp.]|nr:hypothetical protein [Marinobacterium sp.]